MPDEQAQTETHSESSNGVSRSGDAHAAARAAFLAGGEADESKGSTKATREVADDDSDLDDETESDEDADEVEASSDEETDDDSDLDEDEEKAEDEERPDADTAKRISQVQRTEKRMREQIKKDRAAMEAEVEAKAKDYESRVRAEIDKWTPRIEAAERFEKLAARVDIDPEAVLKAAGLKEDRYEHAAQVLYKIAKGKTDPKFAADAAHLMRERERDAELERLAKRDRERDEEAKKERETREEREKTAAVDRQIEAFISDAAKAVSDKTPLAKTLLKNDPDGAREELQIVTFKLAKELGGFPAAKKVAIAFEKRQRDKLRKLGVDPKSRGAAAALTESTTTATKQIDKKTAKSATKADDTEKLSPRDKFISGKYD